MADVQDGDSNAEPSMEEILASIRRIIADEKDPNAAGDAAAPAAVEENALELTQMVQEDGSIVDVSAVEPVQAAPQMISEPLPPTPAPPPPPVAAAPPPPPPPAAKETPELVSAPAADAAVSSLAALANTVQIEKAAAMPSLSRTPFGDNRTLEDMVLELMKPLLKAWLDENLPAIVERLVQKEVERIARRASE